MQTLTYSFPAARSATRPVHVGVVASGDLEILLEPSDSDHDTSAAVRVRTSVDGFDVSGTTCCTAFSPTPRWPGVGNSTISAPPPAW